MTKQYATWASGSQSFKPSGNTTTLRLARSSREDGSEAFKKALQGTVSAGDAQFAVNCFCLVDFVKRQGKVLERRHDRDVESAVGVALSLAEDYQKGGLLDSENKSVVSEKGFLEEQGNIVNIRKEIAATVANSVQETVRKAGVVETLVMAEKVIAYVAARAATSTLPNTDLNKALKWEVPVVAETNKKSVFQSDLVVA